MTILWYLAARFNRPADPISRSPLGHLPPADHVPLFPPSQGPRSENTCKLTVKPLGRPKC